MLFYGKGVEKNMQRASRIHAEAASAGESSAMFIMGELFKDQAKNKAAFWYGLSHVRGYGPALERGIQSAE